MKRLLIIGACLTICMVFAGIVEAAQTVGHLWNCEYEVVNECILLGYVDSIPQYDCSDSLDPCIVVNRVGYNKGDGKWNPLGDTTKCDGYQDSLEDTTSDEMYFECNDQDRVKECSPAFIVSGIMEDNGRCWVGTYDGYTTSMILFQMEYAVTPKLHNHGVYVDSVTSHPDTVITATVVHEMEVDQQIILSDARAFWDGFDDDEDCLGYNCDDDAHSDSGTEWMEFLVADGDEAPDNEVLIGSEFDDGRDAVILDVKSNGLSGKAAGTVPIKVETQSGQFAWKFKGPDALKGDDKAPRADIRGWGASVKSGSGLIKTEGKVDLKMSRSIIKVLPNAGGVFEFSSDTVPDFSGKVEIEMKGSNVTPIIFKGAPSKEAMFALAEGLTVSTTVNPKLVDISPPLIVEDANGKEMEVIEIEGTADCDDVLYEIGKFLVFELDKKKGEYKIEKKMYPLGLGENVTFVYAADGEHLGSRIIIEPVKEVAAEETAGENDENEVADDDKDGKTNYSRKDVQDDDDDPKDNDGAGSEAVSHDCPAGEYWSKHFGVCVKPGSGKGGKKSSSDSQESNADSGSQEDSHGLYVDGSPSNGERVIGAAAGDDGGDDDSITEFAMNGPSGGCSMMPHGASAGAAWTLLPILSLIGFAIRRRFEKRANSCSVPNASL